MTSAVSRLRKPDIAHLLRSVAAITRCSAFVMVGTGAVIAREKTVPLDLMQTREIDIYPFEVPDPDTISTLIDGAIGEGSQFDLTFGYYAHGVSERTACLPDDWRTRAFDFALSAPEAVTCFCPEASDIGLAKLCAWRDKDRTWLRAAALHGVVSVQAMSSRVESITNPNAPPLPEIHRRIAVLAQNMRSGLSNR